MQSTIESQILTTEERKMLKDRLMDENFVRIEDDLARAPRKDNPKKLIGPNLARLTRYLLLFDGRGQMGDNKTHKADGEILDALGIKRDALKSTRELGVAEGVLEWERGVRPGDRRRTTVYRVNVAGLCRKITDNEIVRAERDLLTLEANRTQWAERQREYLGKRLGTLRETRDLMERIFSDAETEGYEHDEADLPDLRDCFECGAPEGHEDWCSVYDGDDDGEEVNEEARSIECVNPQFNVWETHALQQTPSSEKSIEVAGESFACSSDSPGGVVADAPPAGEGEEENDEPMGTTSTPSLDGSPGSDGTDEEMSTAPPETTEQNWERPYAYRWYEAMYPDHDLGELDYERMKRAGAGHADIMRALDAREVE